MATQPNNPAPKNQQRIAELEAERDQLRQEVGDLREQAAAAAANLEEHDAACDERVEAARAELQGKLDACDARATAAEERADTLQDELDDIDTGGLTYDEAVTDATAAYRTSLDALAFVAGGAFDALDVALRTTRAGRISAADATEENVALVLRLAHHVGAPDALRTIVGEVEGDIFDRATGYPAILAPIVGPARAYAEALCDCDGDPIWAEAALWAAIDQVREQLVGWSSSWTLAGASVLAAAHGAVVANLDSLHTCPTPASIGGELEAIALLAGRPHAEARELQLWFDRTRPATEAVLELVQLPIADRAPDRIIDLARLVAPVTIGSSPIRLPLVRATTRRDDARSERAPGIARSRRDGAHLAVSTS